MKKLQIAVTTYYEIEVEDDVSIASLRQDPGTVYELVNGSDGGMSQDYKIKVIKD